MRFRHHISGILPIREVSISGVDIRGVDLSIYQLFCAFCSSHLRYFTILEVSLVQFLFFLCVLACML